MISLPKVPQKFRPALYESAQRCGAVTFGMDCVFREAGYSEDGVLIWRRLPDGTQREKFVTESEIERALEAGLQWRYRLVAGPSVWRVRPLWRRRDSAAYHDLILGAIGDVFSEKAL